MDADWCDDVGRIFECHEIAEHENEKACHPRPVGISDKQRTEHQWQVKASESRELSADPGLSSGAALEPPGLLGLNYGRQTPVVTMLAHVAYGVALGLLLDPS